MANLAGSLSIFASAVRGATIARSALLPQSAMSSGRLLGNKTALSRLWAPLLDYGQRHKPDDQENADHG